MRAQDWQDAENYRNRLLAELMEWCVDHGLNSEANEKRIVIQLPSVQEINAWPEHEKRKRLDFDAMFPSNGVVEGRAEGVYSSDIDMPDELPPTTTPLDEGEAPKGDDET